MSTHPQQTAVRLRSDLVGRVDGVRGLTPRATFVGHLIELGLASFERNPEQAVTNVSIRQSPAATPSPVAAAPTTAASPAPSAPASGVTAKDLARGYVKNAAGVRIPIDADGRPVFS